MEEFVTPTINLAVITPFIIICLAGLILMFVDVFLPEKRKHLTGWLTLLGIVPALIVSVAQWNLGERTKEVWRADGIQDLGLINQAAQNATHAFSTVDGHFLVINDNFSIFLNVIYLLTAILTVLMSAGYLQKAGIQRGEFYFLMLFSVAGMMLMGMANDLLIVFLALELLSIPLYILSGFDLNRSESEESALKYFLLGAFSSGFLVFGIALIYGAVGSTAFPDIFANIGNSGVLGLAGIAMLMVGFAFKVGAVPFHMWTPDVYEGAPTAVTAFMSVGAKVAGFAAMLRVFVGALSSMDAEWVPAVAVISAVTMIVGNISAISQQNIKRMLAYSSIAHAGYLLMAVAAAPKAGVSSALFYMLTYLFTNIGAFALVMALERHEGKLGLMLDDYKGLAKRNFPMALILMYFMFSFIGIPLTAGFTGKFYVFQSAVEAGLVWLVVIAALSSVVSAFYYMRPIFYAFMHDGPAETTSLSPSLGIAILTSLAVTILLGFAPGPLYRIAQEAAFNAATLFAGG